MQKGFTKEQIKTLALSSLGGTLEFYDFIIFVFFTRYFAHHFFPSTLDAFWQELNAYGAFAAAYLARPLGGVVMAHFGDKFGRKNMFMLSILLMVIPTFALAVIPTFETIGYAAAIALLIVRVFQGMALGGELPGAWVFVREHCDERHKGLSIGLLTSSVVGGILLGSIVALIMELCFTKQQLDDWAWRLPFALGGVFGIVSLYLRRYLQETPVFKQMQSSDVLAKFPIKDVLCEHRRGIVVSALITWVLTACVMVFLLLMPNFVPSVLPIDSVPNTIVRMGGIFAMMIGCIASGALSDRYGIAPICVVFTLLWGACGVMYFYEIYIAKDISMMIMWYLLACFGGGVMNFTPLIMLESFPARIRFSGISFSYNLAYAIAGGITPPLMAAVHEMAKHSSGVMSLGAGVYVVGVAVVALISAALVKDRM